MKLKIAWFAISATLLIASCAAPPKQKIDTVYTGLQELLPRFDPAILRSRVIIIDPGHGGFFRGTTGNKGLEEASVNLGVALYLGGLLEESGASVHFTRSADRDFLTPSDSSLTSDLALRLAIVDSVQPDLFISLHHNAQSLRDPAMNAVETYYKFGDPASRDLAIAVHRHLMRNLGIADGAVKQGNYFVLRGVDVPAILGEASYLTNPGVEDKLRISEKQKLEAEAYYLGILDYFRRGTPRIEFVSPQDSLLTAVPEIMFTAEDIGGGGIDPDAVFLAINGELARVVCERNAQMIRYRLPWDAPNGKYDISLHLRNLMGNSSKRIERSFKLDLPPALALFETLPAESRSGWGLQRVRAVLLDKRGLRVMDGSPVDIRSSLDDSPPIPRKTAISNGFVEFFLEPAGDPDSIEVTLACGGKSFAHILRRNPDGVRPASGSPRRIVTLESNTGSPVAGVSVFQGDSMVAIGSNTGIVLLPPSIDRASIVFHAPGYVPRRGLESEDTVSLQPWFGGVLHGKKFVLDPQGGESKTAGVGVLGLPAAHVNLQVAHYCESFLRQSGADVLVTRTTEETAMPQDIVAMTSRFGADRYLEIRHLHSSPGGGSVEPAGLRTYCFPGSKVGRRFADQVALSFGDYFGIADAAAGSQVTYPLQQTACPAIIVEPPSIISTTEELRLGEPWYLRLQAYALFIAILEHYAAPDDGEITVRIDGDGEEANWLVTLDGTWKLLTPPEGGVRFKVVAPGSHTLTIQKHGSLVERRIELKAGESKTVTITPTGGHS
jgi:N-acetylmuramoyl-L-alanine amidase